MSKSNGTFGTVADRMTAQLVKDAMAGRKPTAKKPVGRPPRPYRSLEESTDLVIQWFKDNPESTVTAATLSTVAGIAKPKSRIILEDLVKKGILAFSLDRYTVVYHLASYKPPKGYGHPTPAPAGRKSPLIQDDSDLAFLEVEETPAPAPAPTSNAITEILKRLDGRACTITIQIGK